MNVVISPGTCFFCALLVAASVVLASPGKTQPVVEVTGDDFDVDIYGRIVVLDKVQNTLKLFSPEGLLLKEVGGAGWNQGQFDSPRGVWGRNGIDIFVADYGNHRVQRFDRNLNFVSSFSTRESDDTNIRFGYPSDVALSRQGELFICDNENVRIVKVSGFNNVERAFGGFSAGKGRLFEPSKIEAGPGDYIYVTDKSRVLVYDPFGNFLQELGPVKFSDELLLFGDMKGVVVVNKDTVYCFDMTNRQVSSFPLSLLTQIPSSELKSLVIANGKAYFLTPTEVRTGQNPRELILQE